MSIVVNVLYTTVSYKFTVSLPSWHAAQYS